TATGKTGRKKTNQLSHRRWTANGGPTRTVIEGLTVGGLGGAFSIDQKYRTEGKDWWPNEEPTPEQAEQLLANGPVDILITHDVPVSVPMKSDLKLTADVISEAARTRILLDEVVRKLRPPHLFAGHWHQRRIHELKHEDGSVTRVDVLANELANNGNAVLVWPDETMPLRVEPLRVTTR
ncbi:hypothetical protein ACFSFX_09065, partial [Arthrobacter flavus]